MNFFAYGTLMIPELMMVVCGASFPSRPAMLHDFARYRLEGLTYPGMVPEAGKGIQGRLYLDLMDPHFQRLDRFEGKWYRRESVKVLAGDVLLPAEAYVLVPEYRHHLTHQPWDPSHFHRNHYQQFRSGYAGFSHLEDEFDAS